MDNEAEVLERVGLSGHLTQLFRKVPDRSYPPVEFYDIDKGFVRGRLEEMVDFFDRLDGKAWEQTCILFCFMEPHFASEGTLHQVLRMVLKRETQVHLQVAQGDKETAQMVMRYATRPRPWLAKEGFLDVLLITFHPRDAAGEEARQIAKSGASMVPCSNSIGIIDGPAPGHRGTVHPGGGNPGERRFDPGFAGDRGPGPRGAEERRDRARGERNGNLILLRGGRKEKGRARGGPPFFFVVPVF